MDQQGIPSHSRARDSRRPARAAAIALVATLAVSAEGSAQNLPPICRQPGVPDAIRTLLQFCPSGHCMPRTGMGDLLERRVDRRILERISSDPLLYPVRIFYRRGRGRFESDALVSSDHYRHVVADLRELALTYSRFPGSKIVILGRASQTGRSDQNIRLSQERARRVADHLEHVYRIPADDLHRAYFGSQLFQVRPDDFAELGVTTADLEREAGSGEDISLTVNQSVVAFVFPCPEAERPPPTPANGAGCELDGDGGAPDAGTIEGCLSRITASDAGTPTHVFLLGGALTDLFARYVQVLGRNYGGRDLRTLTVHYAVRGGDGRVTWQSKSSPCSWFTQDLVTAWTDALVGIQGIEAALPSSIGNADVYCASRPPEPRLGGGSNCGACISRPTSATPISAITSLLLLVLARRRSRASTKNSDPC